MRGAGNGGVKAIAQTKKVFFASFLFTKKKTLPVSWLR
jgi:hypothetical protein